MSERSQREQIHSCFQAIPVQGNAPLGFLRESDETSDTLRGETAS